MQLINTLEQYSGLLTFLITFVYAVTTLFIMRANKKAADATLEQVLESRRQFAELNRPRIAVAFVHEKNRFCGLRISNEGQRMAERVRIDLEDEFIASLSSERLKNALLRQEQWECAIGAGQHFDLPLGETEFHGDAHKPLLRGTVHYCCGEQCYSHPFAIDANLCAASFEVSDTADELLQQLAAQTKELKKLRQALETPHSGE